jgi:iron complex transport system permease protein
LRTSIAWAVLVFSLGILLLAGLVIGPLGFSPPRELARTVLELRLARTLLAVLVGSVLGLSGLLIQYSVSNPLASPDILGVLQGAYVASMLVVIVYHGSPPLGASLASGFLGGLAAYGLSILIASRTGFTRTGLVLAGIAVASMLAGASSLLTVLAEALAGVSAALMLLGTFAYATWDSVTVSFVGLVLGLAASLALARGLDALSYGDEIAADLGYRPGTVRLAASGVAALLSAVSVYAVGIVYFVALMAPNAARLLVGGHPSRAIPATLLIGALIGLGADVASRLIALAAGTGEVPGGLLTTIVGGAFLAYMVIRSGAGAEQ